jgi:hypothetical protein
MPSLDGSIGTTLNPHPHPLFCPYNILKQTQRNTKKIEKVKRKIPSRKETRYNYVAKKTVFRIWIRNDLALLDLDLYPYWDAARDPRARKLTKVNK